MIYAFDVDGTLFRMENGVEVKRKEIIEMARALVLQRNTVIVWSGGGEKYARQRVRDAGLDGIGIIALAKGTELLKGKSEKVRPDVVFDDQDVNLGTLNVRV